MAIAHRKTNLRSLPAMRTSSRGLRSYMTSTLLFAMLFPPWYCPVIALPTSSAICTTSSTLF